jgi:hypothetical protein
VLSFDFYLRFLGTWSSIGALLFCVFVIFAFRSGLVYTARNEEGLLKDRIPFIGYLVMALFLVSVIAFLAVADWLGLAKKGISMGALNLFILNYCLYIILFLFDTIFIDGFVLGYWRPGFLRLSGRLGGESMHKHMIKSIPIGAGFGIPIAVLATFVASTLGC